MFLLEKLVVFVKFICVIRAIPSDFNANRLSTFYVQQHDEVCFFPLCYSSIIVCSWKCEVWIGENVDRHLVQYEINSLAVFSLLGPFANPKIKVLFSSLEN